MKQVDFYHLKLIKAYRTHNNTYKNVLFSYSQLLIQRLLLL